MKQLHKINWAGIFLGSIFLLATTILRAQSLTPKAIAINSNTGGFYEYLPQGYNTSAPYPVMIFLHGQGDLGPGTVGTLDSLLNEGPLHYIKTNLFPASFYVNNQEFRFIIIAPQFKQWPTASDVEAVVDYATNHYNINPQRIYVTGMSMGGGVAWEYAGKSSSIARKIAALVPVCGASTPTTSRTQIIANASLAVWATHNQNDPQVPVSNTNDYIAGINQYNPTPLAQKTIFPVSGHDAWTKSYDPAWRENGHSVYEFMLQNQRTAAGPLPVVLTSYQAIVTGRQEVTVSWTTSSEQNNHHFTIEYSTDGTTFSTAGEVLATNLSNGDSYRFVHQPPVAGTYYYRLSQTDIDGKTVKFDIRKIVLDETGTTSLTLFPNPATDYIVLGLPQPAADRIVVKIISSTGVIIQTQTYEKTAGYWQQRIPLRNLQQGIYVVKIQGHEFESTQTLMIRQ